MKSLPKKNNKKLIIMLVVAVLVALGGAVTYGLVARSKGWWPFPTNSQTASSDKGTVDLHPATDEQVKSGYEVKEGEEKAVLDDKKPVNSKPSPEATTSSGKQSIPVTITNYSVQGGALQINAFASTLTKGTCTASIIKNGSVIATKTGATFPQSSYTSCTDLSIPFTESMRGNVTISVKYSNDTQEGESKIDASL